MRTRASSRFVGLVTVALCASTAFVLSAAAPAAAAGFTPGDIVVVRVGTGSGALSNAATAVFLDEYTPAGALVQSVALPTATAGENHRVTMSGTATSEGALALSADGRYLSLAGFDADAGTATVASTTATLTPRVVARVDGNGVVDSRTAITDAFNATDVRGAVTDDGSRFWAVGGNGGVRLAALGGAGSTTAINTAAPTNLRAVGIANGQLHVSTGSSPTGVYAVGAVLPTTGGQIPSLVAPVASPYGFVALDRDPVVPGIDTLYVADDAGIPNGGIVKFSSDGTAWTARGSFRPSGSAVRGLTGAVTPFGVTLYATTSATANELVVVIDSSAFDAPINASSTRLASAPANTAFRGVAFAPSGGVIGGAPTIGTQPQDASITGGTTATLTVGAAGQGPLSYQWYTGSAGDTSAPVGTNAPSFTTPALTATTSYWVRVTGPGGTVDSRTATVTVGVAPPACSTPVVSVGSVQGTVDISPVAGQTVAVRGTVVADFEGPQPALRGFYLQDAGDGELATSDGIFVFDNGANLVANGDVVQVAGVVSEFEGQTQITAGAAGVQSCGQQATVAPVDVTLPAPRPGDLEPYEGMLVRLHQTVYVTEHFQLGRFGQVVVSSGHPLRQPTADHSAGDQTAVQDAQDANDLNRLIVDDANQAQNPDPIVFGRGGQPLSATNTLRGGDALTDAVGVMTYTWAGNNASGNAYRLRPVGALGGAAVFQPINLRPTAPPDVGAGGIKIASANLLNFFNTYTDCRLGTAGDITDCRGATSDLEYQRQLAKEVASLRFLGADVVGYMEMENDGYGPTSAVQALVDALNALDGAGAWAFVDPDAALGVVDVAGTDAIKAGLLYRTASVTAVPGATFVDQNDVFERQPVAQTFRTADGARFTVIANHFKSKGSCPTTGPDIDIGDGQSCWNVHRTAQANELAHWVGSVVIPRAGDPDVAIVGDLNSYAGEDPIAALESAGYVNLIKAIHGDDAYSYVFDGQWGYLDYVMASASLRSQVTGAGDAHHNADEPAVLDYNTDFKTPAQIASLYADDRFRTSDHDPVLAGLDLGVAATISGAPPAGTVGTPYSYGFTLGGDPPVVTEVTVGSPPPGLALSTTGELTGTPTASGEFTFTVRASNAYGSSDEEVAVSIAAATTTTAVTSSANPSTIGAPVQFTATVSGGPTGGTVQFKVDGQALAGPVAVVAGVATSPSTSTLTLGSHAVTADYSGTGDHRPSSGALTQLVRVDIKVLFPTAGARFPGRFIIPIAFQLTDAKGHPISDGSALQLFAARRVTIAASGAQSLAASRPVYDPIFTHTALFAWKTAQRPTGPVTISISVTYPGAPTQVVTIPIVLT